MEATLEKKKPGNPRFQKKLESEVESTKVYEFELVKTYEEYKPTDEKGNKVADLFPPLVTLPNRIVVYDEKTKKQRLARYINSEPSIWVDEQREMDEKEEAAVLIDSDNQIDFRHGKLEVNGIETNKLQFIMALDMFEGKKTQLKKSPRVYRLINPDQVTEDVLDQMDVTWEAEKAARECTEEEMYAFAFVLGINLEQSDKGIRKDFILQAKSNPVFFKKNIVDPKNKLRYTFSNALSNGTLSVNQESGVVSFADSKAFITKVNPTSDIALELAIQAVNNVENVLKAYHQLLKL